MIHKAIIGDNTSALQNLLHSINSSCASGDVLLLLYHLAKNLDFLSLDPYGPDEDVASRIKFSWSLGFEKLSWLLNGMGADNSANGLRMRTSWIAWFMGANSIGW